jgi:hypothetical protein
MCNSQDSTARSGKEIGSWTAAHHLVAWIRMGQIFFASLRLGVFALKSACLIEWIRLKADPPSLHCGATRG